MMITEKLQHTAMKCGLALMAAACMTIGVSSARAEEYKLPDAAEIATFPREAMQFYANGVKSLDRVDYINAYDNLAKAAQMQPGAVRLNLIAAALALKQGRNRPAAEAKNYYETAIACYKNILKQPAVDDEFRRNVANRLKVANDEKNDLAQRDARREAVGGQFVTQYNKELAPKQPNASGKAAAAAAAAATIPTPAAGAYPGMATAAGMPGMSPDAAMGQQPAGPMMPNPGGTPGPGGPSTAGGF